MSDRDYHRERRLQERRKNRHKRKIVILNAISKLKNKLEYKPKTRSISYEQ
jgi:hypothetical protein